MQKMFLCEDGLTYGQAVVPVRDCSKLTVCQTKAYGSKMNNNMVDKNAVFSTKTQGSQKCVTINNIIQHL